MDIIAIILGLAVICIAYREWKSWEPVERSSQVDTCDNEAYCTCGRCYVQPFYGVIPK
jgi:hypothetical protein